MLSYSYEIEKKGELEFNPYLKSEMIHLQKYLDQLSVPPKSPFGVYRRTEEEDFSYCLHKKHSKVMDLLEGRMKNINKELYRLKKMKQAEKKLEFLEFMQSQANGEDESFSKLPDSKVNIPQLSTPKPKYEPIELHSIEDENPPEMSRAMEGFLKQQEKERKEKEFQRQQLEQLQIQQQHQPFQEIKPIASFVPETTTSNDKKKEKSEKKVKSQPESTMVMKEHPLTSSDAKETEKPPLSFAKLRHSSGMMHAHSHPYTSSDPEIPYGAYDNPPLNPQYVTQKFGTSSAGTFPTKTRKSDEKARGFY